MRRRGGLTSLYQRCRQFMVALTILGVLAPCLGVALAHARSLRSRGLVVEREGGAPRPLTDDPLALAASEPAPPSSGGEETGAESPAPGTDEESASDELESIETPAWLAQHGPRRGVEKRAARVGIDEASVRPASVRPRWSWAVRPGAAARVGLSTLLCRHLC